MTPRIPRTGDAMLNITFRCGLVKQYVARQLRWTDTDHAFDVVGYEVANG